MNDLEQFATRLVSERNRLGMTQADFAARCGVKGVSQYLYEKAERTPNAEYLFKAKEIGVDLNFLFGGDSSPSQHGKLSPEQLRILYMDADGKCRDNKGRLLDLEHRLDVFLESYKDAIARTRKWKG